MMNTMKHYAPNLPDLLAGMHAMITDHHKATDFGACSLGAGGTLSWYRK